MRVQEQHDVAHGPLLAPGARDPFREPAPDARDLAQALRPALDHLEHLIAERCDQLLGGGAADAFDHARAEIRLDALERGRRHRDQRVRAELHAVARAGLPAAAGVHDLARGHAGALADHGDRIALLGELDPEHAKSGVRVLERHALDQARQGLWLRLGRGEREGTGCGRRAALTMGLHGAPNLTLPGSFDKPQVEPGAVRSTSRRFGERRATAIERFDPDAGPKGARRSPGREPGMIGGYLCARELLSDAARAAEVSATRPVCAACPLTAPIGRAVAHGAYREKRPIVHCDPRKSGAKASAGAAQESRR